ncbi:MAG: MATE family efflux transporter, partial [Planctomycetota bacterium]
MATESRLPNQGPTAKAQDELTRGITAGNIRRAVFWLALPVLGEQLLNSFIALVDVYLAGQLSKEATAAVGLAAYTEWLASMLFALVATGTTALVARCVGAGDGAGANRFTNQSITLSFISGLAFSALLFALAPTFAGLQDMTGRTYQITVEYIRIDSTALTFTSLTLVGAAALRGAGDTRTPMMILGAVNILNAVVSAALVFGWGPFPTFGVRGIVLGTVVGRVSGGLIMLAVLLYGRGGLRLAWSSLGLHADPVGRLLRIGVPAASDGAVMWAGHFVFLMIVARLAGGELQVAYYAAHMIGVRLEALTYLPATAWAIAAATMIGQNLGAQRPDRATRSGHEATLQCGLLASLVGLLFFVGAEALFRLMHNDVMVHDVGI